MKINYCIYLDYQTRPEAIYDSHVVESNVVWQPHVYDLAILYARRYNFHTIIDVGCGSGRKLADMHNEFDIVGIDYRENIQHCRNTYPKGTWIEHDLETPLPEMTIPKRSIIVCADVVEHLVDPTALMGGLKAMCKQGTMALISTPLRPELHEGPPTPKCHTREWSFNEFVEYSSQYHPPAWIGTTKSNSNPNSEWNTTLVIWTNGIKRKNLEVPNEWAR